MRAQSLSEHSLFKSPLRARQNFFIRIVFDEIEKVLQNPLLSRLPLRENMGRATKHLNHEGNVSATLCYRLRS
jgi:hypothetical protein